MRSFNLKNLLETVSPYLPIEGFYPREWLKDDNNIALTNSNNDFALFEHIDGLYTGHYFFNSRGKEAVKAATDMLDEIFSDTYSVNVIRGLSPLQELGARWLNRKLGFTSHGVVQTKAGPCELVILTKQEWNNKNGRNLRRQ